MKPRNYVAKHLHKSCKPSVQLSKKSSLLISAELQDMEENALEEPVGRYKQYIDEEE